jgi:hypothetical protein
MRLPLLIILVVATSTTAAELRPYSMGSFPIILNEVARHFQRGHERVDCDTIKRLIVRFTEASEARSIAIVNENETDGHEVNEVFTRAVVEFIEYVDTHSLEPGDILEIREWLADSLDARGGCHDDGFLKTMAYRTWVAMGSARGVTAACQPRHTVLFIVFAQPKISLPIVGELKQLAENARRKGKDIKEDEVLQRYGIAKFLTAPENRHLWDACLSESERLSRSRFDNETWVRLGKCLELLPATKNDPDAFKEVIEQSKQLCETLLLSHPGYAVSDRFNEICVFRDVWNAVHAYGNDAAKADYRRYITSLRDFYADHSDRVTVKWLNQVMERAGDPADRKTALKWSTKDGASPCEPEAEAGKKKGGRPRTRSESGRCKQPRACTGLRILVRRARSRGCGR